MNKNSGLAVLTFLLVALSSTVRDIAVGQAHFPYLARNNGEYFEGQRRERPISGIDIELKSLRFLAADGIQNHAEDSAGMLHLAFTLPGSYEPARQTVDIVIQGPKRYFLDRVTRDFSAGYNIFSWSSSIVDGLDLTPDDLAPRIHVLGDLFIPCLLVKTAPMDMPEVESIHALLETNTEGSLRYFLRDAGKLVLEGQQPVFPGIPLEIVLPADSTHHHLDLHVMLEYELEHGTRSIRRCFPINPINLSKAEQ